MGANEGGGTSPPLATATAVERGGKRCAGASAPPPSLATGERDERDERDEAGLPLPRASQGVGSGDEESEPPEQQWCSR